MKLFITGASGFIGGAIAKYYVDQGHRVLAMARSDASAEKVAAHGALPVRCDLDSVAASDLVDCEAVIHCAAYLGPYGKRSEFYQANVVGTERMLKVAREAGVRRFLLMGTEAVLFHGSDMVEVDENTPMPKKTPYLYSETKGIAERKVLAANQEGVFETMSIRPRLVWGPGDTTFLPNLLRVVDNGSFRWVDGGKLRTSSTHIDNLIEGTRLALEKSPGGEAYFIVDGPAITMRRFVELYLGAFGRKAKEKSAPGWLVRFGAWGMDVLWRGLRLKGEPPVSKFAAGVMSRNCIINGGKAERELGYKPIWTVESGMAALKGRSG